MNAELMLRFEALGEDREFGLVQRSAGAEPLALLRFATFAVPPRQRLSRLLQALESGFEGIGLVDKVSVEAGEYMVRDDAFGLTFRTFQPEGSVDPSALRMSEAKKLTFLRHKFFADLAAAAKILVWKSSVDPAEGEIEGLVARLSRFGPNTLLLVRIADDRHPAGTVDVAGERLLMGYVERFAPDDAPDDTAFESWLDVCREALRRLGTNQPARPAAAPAVEDRPAAASDVRLLTLASLIDTADASQWLDHGLGRVDRIVPAGHYRRRPAAAVDTTDLLAREAVFKSYMDSLLQGHGPLRRVILRDALVTDQGSVITSGRALLEESCWEFLAHRHVPYGLAREAGGGFTLTERPTETVEAPSLLLKRPWWRNYGHWLVDAAALLALLVKQGTAGFEQIVIGEAEDPKLRAIFRETIACIAPAARVVEHPDLAMWRFTELHYVEPVRRGPLCMLPEAIEALRVAVLGTTPPPAGDRRLFVSRRNYGRRRLDNEPAVLDVAHRHGFEIVYPETLTLREQALLFRSASAVMGVKGAALTNAIFSPPNACVIALSPADFADPFFWDIAGGRDLAYCEMFGPLVSTDAAQAQNPFAIDPDRLDALVGVALPDAPVAARVIASKPLNASEMPMPDLEAADQPELGGQFYIPCLARIHERTRPRSYLEIGTLDGKTLLLSRCRSVAVDPAFRVTDPLPGAMPSLFLFQGASDAFFDLHDPRALLGGPIDLAFLDGMHLFEFLLRDFMNTERFCHPGSMVVLHDCIPLDLAMTGRNQVDVQSRGNARHPGWWTGDVWKTVDALLHHRPDLDIIALDAPPTGLIVIRNLDPGSTVLKTEYAAILDSYGGRADLPAFAAYRRKLKMYGTSAVDSFEPIRGRGRA